MTCLGEEASLASAAECTRCRTRRPVVAQVSPSRRRWDDRATRKAQEVPADLGRVFFLAMSRVSPAGRPTVVSRLTASIRSRTLGSRQLSIELDTYLRHETTTAQVKITS